MFSISPLPLSSKNCFWEEVRRIAMALMFSIAGVIVINRRRRRRKIAHSTYLA